MYVFYSLVFQICYSNHQASLSHRVSKMNAVDRKVKEEYKTALAHTHTVNIQVNSD